MAGETNVDFQIDDFDPTDPDALKALEGQLFGSGDEGEEGMTDEDAALAELEASDEDEEQEEAQQAEEAVKKDSDEEAKSAKQDDNEEEESSESEGEASNTPEVKKVIKARDGVHEIPYSILERERDTTAEQKRTIEQLQAEIDQLKAGKPSSETKATKLTDEELEAIADQSEEVANALRAMTAQIEELRAENDSLRSDQQRAEERRVQEIQDQVEAAIQKNDTLSAWRDDAMKEDGDKSRWDQAVAFDQALQKSHAWKEKPLEDRFAKAVEMTMDVFGDVKPETKGQPNDKLSQEQADALRDKATKKVKQAGSSTPETLSDIPGGSPAAQSEEEMLENVSVAALEEKMLAMTPDQLEAYITRYA
jgi:DNA repair exonuclease SbcCD ATPase subunit